MKEAFGFLADPGKNLAFGVLGDVVRAGPPVLRQPAFPHASCYCDAIDSVLCIPYRPIRLDDFILPTSFPGINTALI